jgi:hypothetical protein
VKGWSLASVTSHSDSLARSTAISFLSTPYRHRSRPDAGVEDFVFVGGNVGRHELVSVPCLDQFIGQLTAGFDQKRPAPHRGIADFQIENLRRMRRADRTRACLACSIARSDRRIRASISPCVYRRLSSLDGW